MNRRDFVRGGSLALLTPYLSEAMTEDAPISEFDGDSTAEEVTTGIDLSGKTALVTGCNSGIGLETMRVLALRGAHVLGTARTMERGRVACGSVVGQATPLVLELTDFESIVSCAEQVRAMGVAIDMFVCNAGVFLSDFQQVNGLEMHFVVNHLGHFILVNQLLDQVVAAPQGRIVVVSSNSHNSAPDEGIQFENLAGEGDYSANTAYGHSKLANGLFSLELARRLEATNATSNSLHPGVVYTNILRNSSAWLRALVRVLGPLFMKSVEEGAATSCYLAAEPTLEAVSGCYFIDCNPVTPSDHMQDTGMAARLWDISENLTRDYLL